LAAGEPKHNAVASMATTQADSWARLKFGDRDCCYSKRELCKMRWADTLTCELSKCMSAVMSCGGPIALLAGDGTAPASRLQIFTGAGELINAWEWDFGRVRALGWTPNVELVCVLESSRVMLWNLRGVRVADFSLAEACEGQRVLQCELFTDGFVVLTSAFRLFALLSYERERRTIVPLADPRLASPPTAMAVLERGLAPNTASAASAAAGLEGLRAPPRCPEVLLATASRTILVIDERDAHDQLLASGPFLRLAPSPNGKFIAAFAASGKLLVLASDFSRNLSELNTQSPRPPRQLVWCGADSLLLPWERLLLMVGPFGDSVKYSYASPPLLHTEVDGVRILSRESVELLQVSEHPECMLMSMLMGTSECMLMTDCASSHPAPRMTSDLLSVLAFAFSVCLSRPSPSTCRAPSRPRRGSSKRLSPLRPSLRAPTSCFNRSSAANLHRPSSAAYRRHSTRLPSRTRRRCFAPPRLARRACSLMAH